MDVLEGLNPQQVAAVRHGEGPLLVFAGAGSGKTRVLTHRVAHLLSEGSVQPYQVLAVTFTNKAANEMKERLRELVGSDTARSLWVGTFHATCARMLRQHGESIGLDPRFAIYDTGEQLILVRRAVKDLNLDEQRFKPEAVHNAISNAKNELIDPRKYAQSAQGYFEETVASVYARYARALSANHAVDFDDLIMLTVGMLAEEQSVRDYYQGKFHHVLVDEYQDINFAQYRLIQLLVDRYRNLCVVGDDDQSIYRWRGADVRIILKFEEDYPDARVIKLEQNYRSTQNVLTAANSVIRNNRKRRAKELWTDRGAGEPLVLYEAANEQEEAFFAANTATDLVRAGQRRYSDFAVLYRVNAQSRVLEENLLNLRIPYRIVGGLRFYERKEIKDLLAYLRVLVNPFDSVSLLRIINVPSRKIGAKTTEVLQQVADERGWRLWDVVLEAHRLDALTARAQKALGEFGRLMTKLHDRVETTGLTELAEAVANESGYVKALEEARTLEAADRLENLREFLSVTHQFEATAEEPSLEAFLAHVSLVSDIDSMQGGEDAMTLMTLHSAKGLEFPVVFIVGLEEGVFPHARAMGDDSEMEEERRLCYVGITRARDHLYLTHAWRRTLYGQTQCNRRARFLEELPQEVVAVDRQVRLGAQFEVDPFASRHEEPTVPRKSLDLTKLLSGTKLQAKGQTAAAASGGAIQTGDRVRHAKWGEGMVVNTEGAGGDLRATVAFPGMGVKKLVLAYAPLEKVS